MNELVLIVDDEPEILNTLSSVLADEGYQVLKASTGEKAIELYRERRPAAVFLDIWLPDRDGLETLQALRQMDSQAAVIMMSGHGATAAAVKAIKMGAYDYLEKPLSYGPVVDALAGAMESKKAQAGKPGGPILDLSRAYVEAPRQFAPPPDLPIIRTADVAQRTIREPSVIYGMGLHSGGRTGMVFQPLPPNSGIHFVTLPNGTLIPAHLGCVADTEFATTLMRDGESIRTVEHLLSALHARGITNLLIKVHGEIPVLDGSAVEFCNRIEEIGVEEQDAPRKEVIIDRRYEIKSNGDKTLAIEPSDVFSVSYRLRYPPPVNEQSYEFALTSFEAYQEKIARARTFGFLRDIKMINELGLGSGGRLDNFILVGDDNVINTELRFTDEFVRHKILDVIGDMYLLGYPMRGRITACYTGHRDNIALQRAILSTWA
ncbi:MAG: UDP-3-O-acyl-N-acetylglucosamine deacetylase [Acidobacteriota bacterium]